MKQYQHITARAFTQAIYLLTLLFISSVIMVPPAHADLTITPLRITFNDRDRTAEIVLINTSQNTNTYRVDWIHNKQDPNGLYEKIDTPLTPEYNPEDMIVFSPRQVTIPPGGRQRIRLSLRRPPNMPDGEYRAHMRFQKLAHDSTGNEEGPDSGMSLSVVVNLGFSIPVVIRQGNYDAKAKISNVKLIPASGETGGVPQLSFNLKRSGKNSTIGRVHAFWVSPSGEETRIGRTNNIVIYPELDERTVKISLRVSEIRGGSIKVVYEGDGPDRGITFDSVTVPVGY